MTLTLPERVYDGLDKGPRAVESRGHGRHLVGGIDMAERTCSIENCDGDHLARGYCGKHYQRWRTKGDPNKVAFIIGDPHTRFWQKVDASGDCWEWIGRKRLGYGLFKFEEQSVYAHRHAWELLVGPVPKGLELDHLCRNPGCVNPDHLEPVTKRVNWERSSAPSARNARKTHCKYGHPFDEANTYIFEDGVRTMRQCRTCHKRHSRNYHRRAGR